jgi:type II secretory ATPase GspE/PulE/Tfp pilus assembly ATPase PilB-like protein
VVSQRLLRRKSCDADYAGRVPIAELVTMDATLRNAIVQRADAQALAQIYQSQPRYASLWAAAHDLLNQGVTDAAEIGRVIGNSPERS